MLRIEHLTLTLGTTLLVRDLSLSVAAGEVVALMGPSGSGKSTLLNWLIGDLPAAFAAQGTLWLDERRCDALPTEARHIGILFQDDLLFAHLSVGQNLAFALPASERSAARRTLVEQTLADIGLGGYHDRDPATLSGGQRARVSLMRALLAQPQALLLDEPFSKLDAALRLQFRHFVFEQIARLRVPTLMVTHDRADVPPGARVLDLASWQAAG
ncbi:MAG: ATP-binding cassette domain-containing protein [Rhodoferax sp.]